MNVQVLFLFRSWLKVLILSWLRWVLVWMSLDFETDGLERITGACLYKVLYSIFTLFSPRHSEIPTDAQTTEMHSFTFTAHAHSKTYPMVLNPQFLIYAISIIFFCASTDSILWLKLKEISHCIKEGLVLVMWLLVVQLLCDGTDREKKLPKSRAKLGA